MARPIRCIDIYLPLDFNDGRPIPESKYVSLQREFSLGNGRRLQFRAEFFNLPNHPNFRTPGGGSIVVFTGSGRFNPAAWRYTGTATTARQTQFALRYSF